MNLNSIYGRISPHFRIKRLRWFMDRVKPSADTDRMLDVGGYPYNWRDQPPCAKELVVLNIDPFEMDEAFKDDYQARGVVGSACEMEFGDGEFDVVFSNSVIEHVGTWENQVKFASEARRIGGALWVQTPARSFFIEPHYIAPFIHWFPKGVQRRLARWFTPWGWITKPTPAQVDSRLDEIRLLSRQEMEELFPDCEIISEKFCGVFTKSYVALRGRC